MVRFSSLRYDPLLDFIPVTTVSALPYVLTVGPKVPTHVKTLADFIVWCRANPKQATYGSPGVGSPLHFTGVQLGRAAEFEFIHVPYQVAVKAGLTQLSVEIDTIALGDFAQLIKSDFEWWVRSYGPPDLRWRIKGDKIRRPNRHFPIADTGAQLANHSQREANDAIPAARHSSPISCRFEAICCATSRAPVCRYHANHTDKVVVAFRELAEGALWRCGEGNPEPAAVLKCDIRRGRPAEQRAKLAEALIDACAVTLGLPPGRLSVEFTQHSGDEIFQIGSGLGRDWTPAEARKEPPSGMPDRTESAKAESDRPGERRSSPSPR